MGLFAHGAFTINRGPWLHEFSPIHKATCHIERVKSESKKVLEE